MKNTAVEWLENELKKIPFINPKEAFEQAKEMEKQQIMNAHEFGAINWQGGIDNFNSFQENSHYYNETYGGGK